MIDNYRQNSAVYSDVFSLVKASNESATASSAPNSTAPAISSSTSHLPNTGPTSNTINIRSTAETSRTITTSSPTPKAVIPNTSTGPQRYNGLSTGAKAGIAIGVVVLVLTTFAIAFLVWRRQRKRWAQVHKEIPNRAEGNLPAPINGEHNSNITVSALPELINIRNHNYESSPRQMTNAGPDELNRLENERRRILEAIACEQNLERLRNEQREIESRIRTVREN